MGIYIAKALEWVQKPLWEFTNAGGASGGALSSAYNLVASRKADLALAMGATKHPRQMRRD
jgi:acetyl-CoA acetyltransferase